MVKFGETEDPGVREIAVPLPKPGSLSMKYSPAVMFAIALPPITTSSL